MENPLPCRAPTVCYSLKGRFTQMKRKALISLLPSNCYADSSGLTFRGLEISAFTPLMLSGIHLWCSTY